jgi:hypothetical protein
MADQSEAMGWIGKTVLDRDGGEVGPCTTVLFDHTGAPEWIGVDHAGVRRKLPAAGATTQDGRVRVELTAAQVAEAPRLAETPPPETRSGGRDKQVRGAVAAIGGLVIAFLTLRWLRARRAPSQSERLREAAQDSATRAARAGSAALDRTVAVGAPAAAAAGRAAREQGRAASKVAAKKSKAASKVAAKVAAKQSKTASKAAAKQAKIAGALAAALAATAADGVGDLLGSGAEVGHRVGETLGAAPDALADSSKRLRKKWRRLTNRVVMVVALAVGYVAGSAAGRQRYDQIKRTAGKVSAMASGAPTHR